MRQLSVACCHLHTSAEACTCKHADLCHDIRINVIFLLFQKDAGDQEKAACKLKAAKKWLAELRQHEKELKVERHILAAGASSSEPTHWLAFVGTASKYCTMCHKDQDCMLHLALFKENKGVRLQNESLIWHYWTEQTHATCSQDRHNAP